ncbi:transglutaminase-like cysteine peptidase [Pseudahrensia aquimaris]|uniref:Transglutaminase-like cysteine peptidase n=1 Tax=Pseudahrensia aquimaris TaxID=744461 RepID=A0ABW3FE94_9HYPH
MKKIGAALIVLAASQTGELSSNEAHAAKAAHMTTAGRSLRPIGHAMFCQQLPRECEVRTDDDTAPTLTRSKWRKMVLVNARVNSAVQPVTDQEYYGVEEHWTYPDKFGDCEDYVLLKRHMLMQQGFPPSSLLITVVLQPNGDGHAVLTVRTDRGDYILDNLEGKVKAWNETPYKYLKRQSTKHSGKWINIRDNRRKVASN